MKRKKRTKTRRPKGTPLADQYSKYFSPLPYAVDHRQAGSLEQPSPYKPVPSVVTYGIGLPPLVGSVDA